MKKIVIITAMAGLLVGQVAYAGNQLFGFLDGSFYNSAQELKYICFQDNTCMDSSNNVYNKSDILNIANPLPISVVPVTPQVQPTIQNTVSPIVIQPDVQSTTQPVQPNTQPVIQTSQAPSCTLTATDNGNYSGTAPNIAWRIVITWSSTGLPDDTTGVLSGLTGHIGAADTYGVYGYLTGSSGTLLDVLDAPKYIAQLGGVTCLATTNVVSN